MRDIDTAMLCGADFVAVSFVKNRTDVEMARQLATIAGDRHGIKPQIIAKIERAEAIPLLREILDAADGIMVARGDLAVEVGNAAVPALQKRMIKMAKESNKLAITATQMMESMIVNASPTRAEVSDCRTARQLDGIDGGDGRGETAAGKYPVRSSRRWRRSSPRPTAPSRSNSTCSSSTGRSTGRPVDCLRRAVHRLPPARTGGDLRLDRVGLDDALDEPSRRRHPDLRQPTASVATARRLALYRNVRPLHFPTLADRDASLAAAGEAAARAGRGAAG